MSGIVHRSIHALSVMWANAVDAVALRGQTVRFADPLTLPAPPAVVPVRSPVVEHPPELDDGDRNIDLRHGAHANDCLYLDVPGHRCVDATGYEQNRVCLASLCARAGKGVSA